MNELERAHTPRAIAAGMHIGLWVGEVLASAEYWLERGASFALGGGFARKAALLCAVSIATAAGGVTAWSRQVKHSEIQVKLANHSMRTIKTAAILYTSLTGRHPNRLEDLTPKYLPSLPLDPWGRPFAYYQGAGGMEIVSAGPDGQLGTGDDVAIAPFNDSTDL